MPTRRALIAGTALVAAGALIGFFAAGGAAGPSAARPEPAAKPVRIASQPATRSQVAASDLAKVASKRRSGLTVKTRISRKAIKTAPKHGRFIGLTCPRGYTALSGGAATNTIDLLISHSAPIKPTTGHYTPRTWWVAVTNVGIDGSASALPWRPVVNCVNRLRVGK
jgi:hypothetical protein